MGIVRGRMTVLRPIAAPHQPPSSGKVPGCDVGARNRRKKRTSGVPDAMGSQPRRQTRRGYHAMRRSAMIREIVAPAADGTKAISARTRDRVRGTAMHPSTTAALALLAAQPAQAQAPLPAGFVDAAAVVDELVVDMRYFGGNNFVGERNRRLRASALPVVGTGGQRAGRSRARSGGARPWSQSIRLLP